MKASAMREDMGPPMGTRPGNLKVLPLNWHTLLSRQMWARCSNIEGEPQILKLLGQLRSSFNLSTLLFNQRYMCVFPSAMIGPRTHKHSIACVYTTFLQCLPGWQRGRERKKEERKRSAGQADNRRTPKRYERSWTGDVTEPTRMEGAPITGT